MHEVRAKVHLTPGLQLHLVFQYSLKTEQEYGQAGIEPTHDMRMKFQLAPGLQLHSILWVVLLKSRNIIRDRNPRDQSSNTKPIVSLGRAVVDEADARILETFSVIAFIASTGEKTKETRERLLIVNLLFPKWRL